MNKTSWSWRYRRELEDRYVKAAAHVVVLRAALERAKEYAADLRSYCDGWEWKYREEWDREVAMIDQAMSATSRPSPGGSPTPPGQPPGSGPEADTQTHQRAPGEATGPDTEPT